MRFTLFMQETAKILKSLFGVASFSWILVHLVLIVFKKQVLIYEGNTIVLYTEIAFTAFILIWYIGMSIGYIRTGREISDWKASFEQYLAITEIFKRRRQNNDERTG